MGAENSGNEVEAPVLQPEERASSAGLPEVAPRVPLEHAVVQTALVAGPLAGLVAADNATHLGLITVADIGATLAVYERVTGLPAARAALALVDPNSESVAETVFRYIAHLGSIAVVSQFSLDEKARRGDKYGRRADFRVVGTNLLVEIDGLVKWVTSSDEASERVIASNQLRDRWLADQGWEVLHLHWKDLFQPNGEIDVSGVLEKVRTALARPGARTERAA